MDKIYLLSVVVLGMTMGEIVLNSDLVFALKIIAPVSLLISIFTAKYYYK